MVLTPDALLKESIELTLETAPPKLPLKGDNVVLACIHARCVQCAYVVSLLAAKGFGEDAVVAARSLYEVSVTFRAFHAKSGLIALYVCWDDFLKLRRAKENPEVFQLSPEDEEALKKRLQSWEAQGVAFPENYRKHHWYGDGGVSGLARLLDQLHGSGEGTEGFEQREYRVWYSVASSFAHAEGIAALWWKSEGDKGIEVTPKPSGRWSDFARVLAARQLLFMGAAADDLWHGGQVGKKIEALLKNFASGYPGQPANPD